MKRIILSIILAVASFAAHAATPNQYNPNAVVPTGIDVSTQNSTTLLVDHASGAQYMTTEGLRASYSASSPDITPAATATDIFTITGSSTKTIKINRIQITADATSASVLDFYVYFRTAANTGGTTAAITSSSRDSTNAAATATVVKYTANATGLGAGTLIASDHYALPAAASTGYPGTPWFEDFGVRNDQPIVLRGTAQSLAINLNGQTIPAGTNVYVTVFWTEE